MKPSKSAISEVDLLDVVRRLRGHINSLDNSHLLSEKLNQFGDQALTIMAERLANDINNVAASGANLLKHIENSPQFRQLVKKYRPERSEQESDEETEE
jgi:hypothetical protein